MLTAILFYKLLSFNIKDSSAFLFCLICSIFIIPMIIIPILNEIAMFLHFYILTMLLQILASFILVDGILFAACEG